MHHSWDKRRRDISSRRPRCGILVAIALLSASPCRADGEKLKAKTEAYPGEEVNLRKDPNLKKLITGEFQAPTAQEVVDWMRKQSGLNLTLDKSVIADKPIQGSTYIGGMPVKDSMEMLALNRYILGKWRKIGDEYRLYATYTGEPPDIFNLKKPPVAAVPPPPMEKQAEPVVIAAEPVPETAKPAIPAPADKFQLPVVAIVIGGVLVVAIAYALFRRRHKGQG